ncbi:hypothetical protein HAN_2g190 (nucleomorph) [Hemiselmis andersenii]|uniref:Uncharacterized protein n=1 Tax=Hemiselmis andersenii TaxID=464988 RepID=A9BKL4_HEMAN|nr:hypothetical protein HAN_2g190 [Hemiselmis andersenii]ABW98019.1 hypothetical protein HAN_2g190 [Hemiselmis andersenii]
MFLLKLFSLSINYSFSETRTIIIMNEKFIFLNIILSLKLFQEISKKNS